LLPPSAVKLHGSNGSLQRRSSGTSNNGKHGRASSSGSKWRQRLPPWRVMAVAITLVLALVGASLARHAQQVFQPFFVQPQALPVDGQWSRFTLMVMSYGPRLRQLQWYVRHYSRCPSVGEVLVVWNAGEPPRPEDLQSGVPVRVRVEAVNSMNNRFRPDAELQFRWAGQLACRVLQAREASVLVLQMTDK
jgi:hypothetical protein